MSDSKLEDPQTIRAMLIGFVVVLIGLLVADIWIEPHPHFGIDGTPTFFSLYGFGTCALMVLVSKKVVGALLKRKDTYYDAE